MQGAAATVCDYGAVLCFLKDFQAVIGGGFAIFAALVTARQIRRASQRTAEATLNASERAAKAARETMAESIAAAAEREARAFKETSRRRVQEQKDEIHRRRIAGLEHRLSLVGALHGEVRALVAVVLRRNAGEISSRGEDTANDVAERVPHFPSAESHFHVYRAACREIGILNAELTALSVEFYARSIAYLDYNEKIAEGRYESESPRLQAMVKQEINEDLEVISEIGRKLLERLTNERDSIKSDLALLDAEGADNHSRLDEKALVSL